MQAPLLSAPWPLASPARLRGVLVDSAREYGAHAITTLAPVPSHEALDVFQKLSGSRPPPAPEASSTWVLAVAEAASGTQLAIDWGCACRGGVSRRQEAMARRDLGIQARCALSLRPAAASGGPGACQHFCTCLDAASGRPLPVAAHAAPRCAAACRTRNRPAPRTRPRARAAAQQQPWRCGGSSPC